MILTRKKEVQGAAKAAQLRTEAASPFGMLAQTQALGGAQEEMFEAMRAALPILDAAVGKLVRLTGGFDVACRDKRAEDGLRRFLRAAPVGRGQVGIAGFLEAYLDSLLMYGRAVGELVMRGGHLEAVCWGDVRRVHVKQGASPLEVQLCVWENGQERALPYQELLLFSTWNANAAHPYGTSLFASMPFLADVLLRIYRTIGVNWERAGNVRYAVVYRPGSESVQPEQAAEQMAREWSQAMRSTRTGEVRDFVAVGDVEIRVIGADGQVLDSEVPVRQILEQLIAKTGLPPFMLGLSWSSTERMSAQQADLLTSELWALRRCVQPVLEKICRYWLRSEGYGCEAEIVWDDISLQDTVEEAHAALYRAQAEKLRAELGKE